MTATAENKKRIARNTLYLYCRKVIMILIGFYASRLLLERLGDDGFGLYGLIGSVIILFDTLRGVFTAAIQRYVNVAKGSGNPVDVQKVFSLGVTIQCLLAAVFIAVVEIAGVFVIPHLNIAPGMETEAWWVFQFSLAASAVVMLTVPYEALIIAHERFGVFSAMTLAESALRLGAVILLAAWQSERVVRFAALTLGISLVVRIANSVYCRRAFGQEARFRIVSDRKLFREMTLFAGWTFLGGTATSIAHTGLNFVLNIFGGLPLNTARGLAVQIENNALQFTRDVTTSFRPRCLIEYNRGSLGEFYSLIMWNSKVNFFIAATLCCVFCCLATPILRLWLGEVPEHAAVFARLIMLYTVVQALYDPLDTLFRAAGKMKWNMITEAAIMLAVVPAAWILLACGAPFRSAFVVLLCAEAIDYFAFLLLARRLLAFPLGDYARALFGRILLSAALLTGAYFLCSRLIPVGLGAWPTLALLPALTLAAGAVLFFILFTPHERNRLLALIKLKRPEEK